MCQVLELLGNFPALEQGSEHIAIFQDILGAELVEIKVKAAILEILLADVKG